MRWRKPSPILKRTKTTIKSGRYPISVFVLPCAKAGTPRRAFVYNGWKADVCEEGHFLNELQF